jgi:hypothetical protein
VAGSRWTRPFGIDGSRAALAALCAFVVGLGLWNVAHYPPGMGYDAAANIEYADGLVPGGDLPHGTGSYYTPPGYYAVAGTATWIAAKLGVGEPHRAGTGINVLFLLGTVLLVRLIALELWPGREPAALTAAAFVALLPVTVKAEAMFHAETMSLFLVALALWLALRTFAHPKYALALGVTLGAAQLVRAFALWTVAAVAIALLAGGRRRELAIVVALAALIPAPWYIHQRLEYGGSVFPRDPPAAAAAKPIYERRPWRFYVDPGMPDVLTNPYRPHFLNRALPTTYSELWGDYFGIWVWKGRGAPSDSDRAQLQLQSALGILPTGLAIVGWLGFLRATRRRPARLAVALLPALGILGYLYFTVSYPTADGDVLKATYMLTTTPAWAIGFAYAVDRLKGWRRIAIPVLLAALALAQLPFLVYP